MGYAKLQSFFTSAVICCHSHSNVAIKQEVAVTRTKVTGLIMNLTWIKLCYRILHYACINTALPAANRKCLICSGDNLSTFTQTQPGCHWDQDETSLLKCFRWRAWPWQCSKLRRPTTNGNILQTCISWSASGVIRLTFWPKHMYILISCFCSSTLYRQIQQTEILGLHYPMIKIPSKGLCNILQGALKMQ